MFTLSSREKAGVRGNGAPNCNDTAEVRAGLVDNELR
jgi:hypothetical protein